MRRRPDLCMVIADLSAGGAQRVFSQLANAWAAEGRTISVVTLSEERSDFFRLRPEIGRISIGGLAHSRGPIDALRANFQRIRALRRALRMCGAPLVLSFTGAMNVMTVLAARGLGVKVCISERNDPARQSLGRVWDFLRRRTYPWANRVTANSQGALAALEHFVAADKLMYVPNPVAKPPSSVVAPMPGPTILNVGRLTWQKGQDLLIEAFALIAKDHQDWRLVIIGTGDCEADLREQAVRHGIADRLMFTGQVDDPFPFLRAAEIFALPSRFEGTPNAMLEAMSVSLPCIISNASGGPLDYITDGETGLVVASDDMRQLSAALRRLIEAPDLRARLGAAAADRLRPQTMDVVLETWAGVLDLPPAPAA
jgi:GalNAc-alpha-(1->4)-GalNAc-alpha-(1->3)-diNAcBac-PP-undecaprenol alpha-1,4-N-acetyl-D-galactosaminyltransferase